MIKKTLQMSYDTNGYRYDIPIFIINDPTKYMEDEEEDEEPIIDKDLVVSLVGCDVSG